VVYAEVTSRKQRYRSMPLQLRAASGSKVTIYLFPRIMFRFQLDAEVEDELFAVRGRFEVTNYSFSPYRGGPDGMVVALPRGFKGAVIADNDQAEVAVAPGEGFRIIRPIPPGGRQFHAAFSLPVEAGTATWALDLPLGTFDSELVIRQTPNMVVHTPPSFQGESKTVPQGTFFVLAPLRIQKGQSMAMTIEGLPSPPRWRAWVQGAVGVLVLGVMLAGVGFAVFARRPALAAAGDEARRQRLLDELVQLERTGGSPKRREQLVRELEELWL
jgi:hypothetical protein